MSSLLVNRRATKKWKPLSVLLSCVLVVGALATVAPGSVQAASDGYTPAPWSTPLQFPKVDRGKLCHVGVTDEVCALEVAQQSQVIDRQLDTTIPQSADVNVDVPAPVRRVVGTTNLTGSSPPAFERRITIPIKEADIQILKGGTTRMWTFGGTFPGTTIRVPSGTPVKVRFVNQLPTSAGSLTVHNHGGHSPANSDGQPDSQLIPPGGSREYNYPLMEYGEPERAAFQWYHDHRMDLTARNVWKGLAGMFIIDDQFEKSLPLPKEPFDLPLMIADRSFVAKKEAPPFCIGADCTQLTNPFPEGGPAGGNPPNDPVIGEHILVNGAIKPFFNVGERRYRIRLLNASNFRTYTFGLLKKNCLEDCGDRSPECHTFEALRLIDSSDAEEWQKPVKVPCANETGTMTQIATESGLLPQAVTRKDIKLLPAERAEVVVDFSGGPYTINGRKMDVPQSYVILYDNESQPPEPLLVFKVHRDRSPKNGKDDHVEDKSSVPSSLRPLPDIPTQGPVRKWKFSGPASHAGKNHSVWKVNGEPFDPLRFSAFPVAERPEIWEFEGHAVEHVIHVHSSDFRVLTRDGKPAPDYEALKETVRLGKNERVRVAVKFTDHSGRFMLHCHMLEHEDNGLMSQFYVKPWYDPMSEQLLSQNAVPPSVWPGIPPGIPPP